LTVKDGFLVSKYRGDSMVLKALLMTTCLLSAGSVLAAVSAEEIDFFTISKVETKEITKDVFNQETSKTLSVDNYYNDFNNPVDPIDRAGKVIQVARDLVALGEDIYKLIDHGRPHITTKYAPISVVPKVNGQPVDVMDTEKWAPVPRVKKYSITYFNRFNVAVVTFKFKVMWAYGGSYDGKGAYISGAQIVPEADVLWGFDFSATMKLGGIQNNGTRTNPLAAATLLIEHNVSNILRSTTKVTTILIDGKGRNKQL
jgi:hypothetical protein